MRHETEAVLGTPTIQCPYRGEFESEGNDPEFCEICTSFMRTPSKDSDKGRAFLCRKDCMTPDLVYVELNNLLPWE